MRQIRDSQIPMWLHGISAAVVYLAAAVLAGRRFSNVPSELLGMGCLLGVFKFVPLYGVTILVQYALVSGLRRYSRKVRLMACAVPPVVVLVGVLVWACRSTADSEKALAFQAFFSSRPTSVEVRAYNYTRSLTGGGAYVLVFKTTKEELLRLMEGAGYARADINSESPLWRLSLCNSTIASLSSERIKVDASFECFSRTSTTNRARVFFDQTKDQGVFVGYGAYDSRAWGVEVQSQAEDGAQDP